MIVSPYILGSGKAAQAILEALRVVELTCPEIKFSPPVHLKRGESFPNVRSAQTPVLFIANPHALHAQAIIDGEAAGFQLIVCEKPAAVSKEQIEKLLSVKTPVAVCHVYRAMWGIQKLSELLQSGTLGELIALEGRYWQSSSAQKALMSVTPTSWKNDPSLSGESDVLIDIASHWVDTAIFLAGKNPSAVDVWRSYKNAERPHRDTHVQLSMSFGDYRASASVSKTVHGSPNHFEINLIGTKKYAAWKFLEPDIIELSEGTTRTFIARSGSAIGSGHGPHHGLGWVEGYVEIIRNALLKKNYPTLAENLNVMGLLLS